MWSRVGEECRTCRTALYGKLFLREPAGLARLGCILLILVGVVGLNLLHNASGGETA
ncbi:MULTISPECIES: hypothetical protein [unclassified Gordonia (in: high G+C Gram-positive bacteria)]|uniref:hypothetical protein n=1 Tax=unclassified Gordonia (in: high G+C Gram-positive bacteria) TaxID=2657482 RepID=UPI001E59CF8B|nr:MULTISPECIES: hypothetical protein [unclassified Gordonia (in: high G+C Gram-positive bacteria)]